MLDLVQNVLALGVPDVTGGLGIAQDQEGGDGAGQFASRAEAALAQVEGDVAKEALH